MDEGGGEHGYRLGFKETRSQSALNGPPVTSFAGVMVSLLLLVWLHSACASIGVGNMALILETAPEIVDVTSNSARVKAITTIDLVCSVAYGPTRDYGRLATDTDMAGGGHRDHKPMLTGVEPDTEYHMTFGGIGPDATVYRYKDITFRTKKLDPGVTRPPGENLALLSGGARVLGASSNFGGAGYADTWGGNQAIDGNAATQWSSDGDGDNAWIEIELPAETRVKTLGFWTRTMGSSAEIQSFRVVSDGGDVAGPFQLTDAGSVHYFETDLTSRRLRFEVAESGGGNTGAVEIGVYGEQLP